MVVELRDRVDAVGVRLPSTIAGDAAPADPVAEATVALQQLGYKPVEASRLVQKVAAEGDTAEAIIRKALRAALGS
jgi:Holliday junction DNA helicase RuvA